MEVTIQSSKGPVRFHGIGEPIVCSPTGRVRFDEEYRRQLARCFDTDPDYQLRPGMTSDDVATKMLAALDTGRANKEGKAFARTCKALGISHTYKAINAYRNA